jgi:hypothetical protein
VIGRGPSAGAGGLFYWRLAVRCARVHFSGGRFGADWRGLRAQDGAGGAAEYGDSGDVRVADHAGALRCAGEPAEVQKRAGDVPRRVRADCGAVKGSLHTSGGGKTGQPRRLSLRGLLRGHGIL